MDLSPYETLFADIEALVKRSASLLEFAGLQEDFDYDQLLEILPTLQRFLKDDGPQALIEE